jgi:hypothetical protein
MNINTVANGGQVILSAGLAGLTAQLFKFIWNFIVERHVNFRLMVQTGGMPSSHSAMMSGMAFSVGLVDGFQSTVFAVALSTALIVMYDAAGVRRAAGRMAGILNKVVEDVYAHKPEHLPERMRELLGHTPFEVMVGCLLGIVMAICINKL